MVCLEPSAESGVELGQGLDYDSTVHRNAKIKVNLNLNEREKTLVDPLEDPLQPRFLAFPIQSESHSRFVMALERNDLLIHIFKYRRYCGCH